MSSRLCFSSGLGLLAFVVSVMAVALGSTGASGPPPATVGLAEATAPPNQEWAAALHLPAALQGGAARVVTPRAAMDVVLVVDASDDAGPRAVRSAKLGARRFLGTMAAGSRAGVVSAGGNARVVLPLTDNLTEAHRALSRLRAGGRRDLGRGVTLAADELVGHRRSPQSPVAIVVLTTLPEPEWPADAARAARRARDSGLTLLVPQLRPAATPHP